MHLAVIGISFTIGVTVFVGWLSVMLHHDRVHRIALAAASREYAGTHRRAARSARYIPEPAPALPVVRPGSFCRVPGNRATSKHGTVLVCEAYGNARPRWRKTADRVAA